MSKKCTLIILGRVSFLMLTPSPSNWTWKVTNPLSFKSTIKLYIFHNSYINTIISYKSEIKVKIVKKYMYNGK